MAKLICSGAQKCVHKRNANGVMVCGKFENKSDCIHARNVAEMNKDVEDA